MTTCGHVANNAAIPGSMLTCAKGTQLKMASVRRDDPPERQEPPQPTSRPEPPKKGGALPMPEGPASQGNRQHRVNKGKGPRQRQRDKHFPRAAFTTAPPERATHGVGRTRLPVPKVKGAPTSPAEERRKCAPNPASKGAAARGGCTA